MAQEIYVDPQVASLTGLIDTFIRWKQLRDIGKRSYKHYHPSEWGMCLRKQQYLHYAELGYVKTEPVINDSKLQRLFDTGHSMHHRWQQDYFAEMGILRGVWDCPRCDKRYGLEEKIGVFNPDECGCGYKGIFKYREVTVAAPELNIKGNCDIILDFSRFDPDSFKGVRRAFNPETLPKKPIVIDMKSVGDWQWKNQVLKSGVHRKYVVQLNYYVHVLDCAYGLVIYENKSDSDTRTFKIDRDDKMFELIRQQALFMANLAANTGPDGASLPLLPPPKPAEKSDYECKNCQFAGICHKSEVWNNPKLPVIRKRFYGMML